MRRRKCWGKCLASQNSVLCLSVSWKILKSSKLNYTPISNDKITCYFLRGIIPARSLLKLTASLGISGRNCRSSLEFFYYESFSIYLLFMKVYWVLGPLIDEVNSLLRWIQPIRGLPRSAQHPTLPAQPATAAVSATTATAPVSPTAAVSPAAVLSPSSRGIPASTGEIKIIVVSSFNYCPCWKTLHLLPTVRTWVQVVVLLIVPARGFF